MYNMYEQRKGESVDSHQYKAPEDDYLPINERSNDNYNLNDVSAFNIESAIFTIDTLCCRPNLPKKYLVECWEANRCQMAVDCCEPVVKEQILITCFQPISLPILITVK